MGEGAGGSSLASPSHAQSLRSVSAGASISSLRGRPTRLPWTVEVTYRAEARRKFRRSPSPRPASREGSTIMETTPHSRPPPIVVPSPPRSPMSQHLSPSAVSRGQPSPRAGALSARSYLEMPRPATRNGSSGGDSWMAARPSTRGGEGSTRGTQSARPSTSGGASFDGSGSSAHRGHDGGFLMPSVRFARLASTVASRPKRREYLRHIRALRKDLDSTVGSFYYGGALPKLDDDLRPFVHTT